MADQSIHQAARLGDSALVKRLLVATPGLINTFGSAQDTPLHIACGLGFSRVVEVLLACPGINLEAGLHESSLPDSRGPPRMGNNTVLRLGGVNVWVHRHGSLPSGFSCPRRRHNHRLRVDEQTRNQTTQSCEGNVRNRTNVAETLGKCVSLAEVQRGRVVGAQGGRYAGYEQWWWR